MTQPQDIQRHIQDAAGYAVLLSRFEALMTQFVEFRAEFHKYAERSGDRITEIELTHKATSIQLEQHRDDVRDLEIKFDKSIEERRRLVEQNTDSQREISQRVTALETAMTDLQQIKTMVMGQLIALIITILGGGGIIAYVLSQLQAAKP